MTHSAAPPPKIDLPPARRIRGFSFDPSLSGKFETRVVNERVYLVRWEDRLQPGPTGEYLEVVDFDPASRSWYEPVDLDAPLLLAQDGLAPDASNPMFHQQMAYAVGMITIQNFERALGRGTVWRAKRRKPPNKNLRDPGAIYPPSLDEWVPTLRIYPHALRDCNAYYSPEKVALLFGYFPSGEITAQGQYPGGIVFTCLSHDVVAHEMAHALLDGVHPRLTEWTQSDGPAFHEAFADLVALFQHFTFKDVLRHQIARTRGDLQTENLLGALAQEFGRATGAHGALRDALGDVNPETGKWERRRPDPDRLTTTHEAHERGAILVAAVFDAFITIYESRIADLRRIASGGTGILPAGELHPDLVARFADEAARSATHVLGICIRAVDYCPPVDITFGDYLRALITADRDVFPSDGHGYRVAFIDAFRNHGIYPKNLRALSEQSLVWDPVSEADQQHDQLAAIVSMLKTYLTAQHFIPDRKKRWEKSYDARKKIWQLIDGWLREGRLKGAAPSRFEEISGLNFEYESRKELLTRQVHIYTLSAVQRVNEEGRTMNQAVVTLLQRRRFVTDREAADPTKLDVWGGCTLVFDLDNDCLLYSVRKNLDPDSPRVAHALREATSNPPTGEGWGEPFAALHRHPRSCRSTHHFG